MSGDPKQLNLGKSEMKKIADSVSFSSESKSVEAPWEKPLKAPEELPFLTRHPIPWGWVIFWIVIGLFVWWRIKKRKKKKQMHESKEKESKKD